jgi:beta-RFAP synthase
MIRVVAPSRLHFGLFRVPPAGAGGADPGERAFGGVGLMVDRPGVAVTVRPAASWQFEGPLASRAQVFAARFVRTLPEDRRRTFQVLVERCPVEHTGLGAGTQLGLAVAKALAIGCGVPALSAADLAVRVGRGERSAIGVHGFDRGGLLVDAGKLTGEGVAPLLSHVALPREWRVVLFAPPTAGRWHGENERAAFAAARTGDAAALRRLAGDVLVPAAERGDVDAFGDAVHEFNRKAGEPFAAAQGGAYASGAIAELIADVRACGVRGAGQSSWGPTAFAVVGDSDTALALVLRFRSRVPAFVARVSTGHTVDGG